MKSIKWWDQSFSKWFISALDDNISLPGHWECSGHVLLLSHLGKVDCAETENPLKYLYSQPPRRRPAHIATPPCWQLLFSFKTTFLFVNFESLCEVSSWYFPPWLGAPPTDLPVPGDERRRVSTRPALQQDLGPGASHHSAARLQAVDCRGHCK